MTETGTQTETEPVKIVEKSKKVTYSERETRLVIAWMLITFGITQFINWAILTTGAPRPPYVIDLLLPAMMLIAGVYVLRRKIPEHKGL